MILFCLEIKMGIEMSTSYISLRENPLLQVLVGNTPIPEGDPFWNEILNFSFCPPSSISDNRLLTDVLYESLTQLSRNDTQTQHFSRITNCFLQRAPSLADDTMSKNVFFVQKTLNALFLSRIFLQFFIQNQTHSEVIQHFSSTNSKQKYHHVRSKSDSFRLSQKLHTANSLPHLSPVIPIRHITSQHSPTESNGVPDENGKHSTAQYGKLITSLFRIVTEVEVKDSTLPIHVETIRYLIVILGTQLFSSSLKPDGDLFLVTILSTKRPVIIEMVIRLLENITQFTAKPLQPVDQTSYLTYVPGYTWLFGANAKFNTPPTTNNPIVNQELLKNFSTHLLLLLLLQNPLKTQTNNPYQSVFSNFKDFIDTPPLASPGLVTSYERYYNAICGYLHQEETVLLLYQTLLTHSAMKSYIWSKTEFSQILIPLLETLNSAESTSLHHIYMITIIILIMSQDTGFCTCIHTQTMDVITWYRVRLYDISLGSLLVLTAVNLLLTNITHLRDQYIHSNSKAILANIAAKIQNLHSIPAQKVINVFEVIAKKYKIARKTQNSEECSISLLEDILHIDLALINSVLAKNLTSNPHLVYNLIYRKEVFIEFRTHPEFGMLIENIFSVVDFFETQLKIHAVFNTSEEGFTILRELSRKWPVNGLRHFPEQKYKYCEEDQPDEFFIPYIWTLIYRHSGLYWEHGKIRLSCVNTNLS